MRIGTVSLRVERARIQQQHKSVNRIAQLATASRTDLLDSNEVSDRQALGLCQDSETGEESATWL
jgi:hypothetical protein